MKERTDFVWKLKGGCFKVDIFDPLGFFLALALALMNKERERQYILYSK